MCVFFRLVTPDQLKSQLHIGCTESDKICATCHLLPCYHFCGTELSSVELSLTVNEQSVTEHEFAGTDDKAKATEVVNDVSTGGGSGNSTASDSGTAGNSMTGSGSDSGNASTTGSGSSDQESGSKTSGSSTEAAASGSGSETTGTGTSSQAAASQDAAETTTVTPPVSGTSAVSSAWALSIVLGAVAILV